MDRRNFFKNLAALATPAAALATVAARNAGASVVKAVGMGNKNIPNVRVQGHDGKAYHFYDDLVKGKTVLINFFYADCVGICPRMTSNLKKIQALLGDAVGRDTFIYSISLKPEKDSPKHLAEYAKMHGIKPNSGWILLHARRPDMELLRERLGFKDSDPVLDKNINEHTGMLRFGNDVWNSWAACPLLSNPENIVRDIAWTDLSKPHRGLS